MQSDYKNIKKINDYQNYFKYFIVKDELKKIISMKLFVKLNLINLKLMIY